jgi:tetratricopeptide (TPR) repeat protein
MKSVVLRKLRLHPLRFVGLLATTVGLGLWIAGNPSGDMVAAIGAIFMFYFWGDTVRTANLAFLIIRERDARKAYQAGDYTTAEFEAARAVRSARRMAFRYDSDLEVLGRAMLLHVGTLAHLPREAESVVVTQEAVAVLRLAADLDPGPAQQLNDALIYLEAARSDLPTYGRVTPAADEMLDERRRYAAHGRDRLISGLKFVAERHLELSESDAARPLLEQAVRLLRDATLDNPARGSDLADMLLQLGHCQSQTDEHALALTTYHEALAVAHRAGTPTDDDLIALVYSLSEELQALHRDEEALPLAWQLVEIVRPAATGTAERHHRLRLPGMLTVVAAILSDLHRHEEALAVSQEVLDTYRSSEDARPGWIAAALQNVIGTLRKLGRYDEAEPLIEELAELRLREEF